MTLLHVDLAVFNGAAVMVERIELSLSQGQAVTIIGETGSGKSLLAQAILGTLPSGLSAEGTLMIEGNAIALTNPAALESLWGTHISVLPQEPWRALDPLMHAKQQVQEVYQCVAHHVQASEQADIDLDALDLTDAKKRYPFELSGGMAQRLAIAAARAGGARIVVADEPTKGLDSARRDEVAARLRKVPEAGGALLTITHDLQLAEALGGEIIVLRKGRVVERGLSNALLHHPKDAYTSDLISAQPRHWQAQKPLQQGATVLEARGLSITRGNRTLFKNLDLALSSGEIVGVSGPSGVGKSSLGDLLLGVLKPDQGAVSRAEGLAKTRFQKLWQDPPAAFPAHQTLGCGLTDLMDLHAIPHHTLTPLLEKLRLAPELLARKPEAVSGGELQRLAIARALLLDPVFLFADEPTSRLDPLTQREVIQLLTDLAREQGIAILLVSHDPDLIAKTTDRQIELRYV